MDDAGGNFGKFDSADVDRLDEELPIFRCFLVLLVLCFLELLLEEQNDLFDITTGSKAKNNVDSFPADLEIGAAAKIQQGSPFALGYPTSKVSAGYP